MNGKVVFITGCGSFAIAFANHICTAFSPKKVVFISRDEYMQEEAKKKVVRPGSCRWILGDIRGRKLKQHMRQADIVIHAAALKRVDAIEYNPLEAAEVNVDGTINVIEACIEGHVEKAVFLSTDKAVQPINFYGYTKGLAEKLWLDANFIKPVFTATRYGNVMGSRGSVLPLFQAVPRGKPFPLTDPKMTRFWVDMREAIQICLTASKTQAGSVVVSKTRGFRVKDLALALRATAKFNTVGLRPGEKLHECLISEYECSRAIDCDGHYWLTPEIKYEERMTWPQGDLKAPLMSNDDLMSVEEIKEKL